MATRRTDGPPLVGTRSADEARRFVREHTTRQRLTTVPEISLWLAHEPTALWSATATWLEERGIEAPFWAFAWAGGQAVARAILDRTIDVRDARVLDVASGSGLIAIAAMLAGARSATAVDVDPLARIATEENALLNAVTIDARTGDALLDSGGEYDVVTAGDVFYESEMAARFTERLSCWSTLGLRVFAGDPGRSYVPKGMREVLRTRVATPVELEGKTSIATRVFAWPGPT